MALIATSWVTEGVVLAAWLVVAAFLYFREVRKKRQSTQTVQSSAAQSDDDDPNPLRNQSELVFRVVGLVVLALFAPKWLGSAGWGWNVQSVVVALGLVSLIAWIGTDYVRWRRRRAQESG